MTEAREKNDVFKTAPGVDPRIQQFSAADKMKADFGLDIPVEIAPLPSNGIIYSPDSPLHGRDSIEIKAMTAREEDILTSKAYLKKGTVISELIKSCMMEKGVDPRDMLTGDRNALMVAIRVTGYGADYKAEVECPECGTKAPHDFDLTNLPIKRLDLSPLAMGQNAFEFTLPVSKKTVRFRFLTGRDEEEIVATGEKQKKLGVSTESTVTTSLLYSIISIDGIEERAKIAQFVRMMPARDSLALRNYIRENEPGIEMKQETSCPACGHQEEVNMPLGVNFLWPSAGR